MQKNAKKKKRLQVPLIPRKWLKKKNEHYKKISFFPTGFNELVIIIIEIILNLAKYAKRLWKHSFRNRLDGRVVLTFHIIMIFSSNETANFGTGYRVKLSQFSTKYNQRFTINHNLQIWPHIYLIQRNINIPTIHELYNGEIHYSGPSAPLPASRSRLKACSSVAGSTPLPTSSCLLLSPKKVDQNNNINNCYDQTRRKPNFT